LSINYNTQLRNDIFWCLNILDEEPEV
jgi:hypothetical protein